ncbi:pyocin knob domain-containing protein [Lachnospiraceae bacterium 62-35]
MNYNELWNEISNSLFTHVKNLISRAPYDKTFNAKVLKKLSDRKYQILYKNARYTARYNGLVNIGDIVHVCAPKNNWSELFILDGNHDKDWISGQILLKTDLVNNALATTAGLGALDAAMGKTLGDRIDLLNSNIIKNKGGVSGISHDPTKHTLGIWNNNTVVGKIELGNIFKYMGSFSTESNFDNIMEQGIYRYTGGPVNHPGTTNDYGICCVFRAGSYVVQLIFSYLASTNYAVYTRSTTTSSGDNWTPWKKITSNLETKAI